MEDEPSDLPEFDNPPVVETALGVQFAPTPGITSGHFGWYWKARLDGSWTKTVDAPPLPDQFERFGEKRTWNWNLLPVPQIKIMIENPVRLQIISASDERVIQLQNSRCIYNWRKKDEHYPRFDALYPEFLERLHGFRKFLREADLEDIVPNQWEITYVNNIPKGELWSTPADWHNVFPGLYLPPRRLGLVRLEGITGEWHFEITPQRGRVHVSGQHVKRIETGEEFLQVQLVSRGPIEQEASDRGIAAGIELGHRALVQTFVSLSSDAAHECWGIKDNARHSG
jgi:uncharacterized protein (TIGR04255 family)